MPTPTPCSGNNSNTTPAHHRIASSAATRHINCESKRQSIDCSLDSCPKHNHTAAASPLAPFRCFPLHSMTRFTTGPRYPPLSQEKPNQTETVPLPTTQPIPFQATETRNPCLRRAFDHIASSLAVTSAVLSTCATRPSGSNPHHHPLLSQEKPKSNGRHSHPSTHSHSILQRRLRNTPHNTVSSYPAHTHHPPTPSFRLSERIPSAPPHPHACKRRSDQHITIQACRRSYFRRPFQP